MSIVPDVEKFALENRIAQLKLSIAKGQADILSLTLGAVGDEYRSSQIDALQAQLSDLEAEYRATYGA